MHHFKIFFILLILSASVTACKQNAAQSIVTSQQENNSDSVNQLHYQFLQTKAQEALEFCSNKNYNTSYCLLINMRKHSGLYRFYVWDFELQKAIDSGLVSHGCCNKPWAGDYSREEVQFSNVPDSHCSSLGKYKVGKRGVSSWGIKVNYLIHGLEETNDNAVARSVVLHSWEAITDNEIYPKGSAESWGCPAVSNAFMTRLDERLQKSDKSVLLWIFN